MYRFLQSLILRAGALKAAVMAAVATAAVVAGSAGLLVYLMHVTAVTEHHLQIGEVFAITLATAVVCLVIALPSFTLIDERLRKESELERLIEELRITQDRLSASENRFRHIAESASDWFCEMDADLRFTYFSPRAEEVVGVPVAFHLGKTRAELAGEDVATEKWQRHLDDLKNHRPFRDFQFVRKGHDGRLQTLSTSGKPLFDADGAFTGYIGVGSDITPQLEAEETARLAQERLAHAIDQLSELFVLWGPDDRLVMCNEQFRRVNAAIQEATVPGTLFADHIRAGLDAGLYSGVRGHETDWLAERLQRHRNPGEPFELERHDGLWLYVHEQPFPDGSIATISIDITARKSAEREMMAAKESAEAANRSKSDFLARMSHELRTPLNAIIGFSQIIRSETLGPVGTPAYKSYAEDILTSGELLLSLINDLLDLSRIEAGKYEINDDLVDLGDAAADKDRKRRAEGEDRCVVAGCAAAPRLVQRIGDDLERGHV
ncbi:MAG: histidine kinase dimerization/phospho-acceptor domain-containing protein, partial [Rhodospirillaceae bacterium]